MSLEGIYEELAIGVEELMRLSSLFYKRKMDKELESQIWQLSCKIEKMLKRLGGSLYENHKVMIHKIRIFLENPHIEPYAMISQECLEFHNRLKEL